MNIEPLFRTLEPRLHLLVCSDSDLCDTMWSTQRYDARSAARLIRGAKSRTCPALFDECAAALQIPYYFGENWDAFAECLEDLEWLNASAYVLAISHAVNLLDSESPAEFKTFVDILRRVAEKWAVADEGKLPAARPFHVLFHATTDEKTRLATRCHAFGITPFGKL